MSPDSLPDASPEPPPPPRLGGAFTAFLLPIGAVAGVILLFALATTDRLVIPGMLDDRAGGEVALFGVRLGPTGPVHPALWGIGFLLLFSGLGGLLGAAVGRGLDRLSRWGT